MPPQREARGFDLSGYIVLSEHMDYIIILESMLTVQNDNQVDVILSDL